MSTRAIRFLKQKKIPFEVVTYAPAQKGAMFASIATGYSLEKTVKTLVVNLGNGRYALVLTSGAKKFSLKQLAKVCSVKRATMADAQTAERITGYLVGGISPFGTKKQLPVIMEEKILQFEEVMINAGQRGTMLVMASADIKAVLASAVAKFA